MGEGNNNPQTDLQVENNSSEGYEIELSSLMCNDYFVNVTQDDGMMSMGRIKHYIKYPMIYNSILRTISRQAYYSDGLYGQSIDRMVALPTLSYITTLRSKTEAMKKEKKRFNNILKMLNIERSTRDILRNLLIEGFAVCILRDTTARNNNLDVSSGMIEALDRLEGLTLDDNFMLQPLDLDYCKIVGFQNNISVAAFDMQYFDQFKHGGLVKEIKNYPTEFIKAYNEYKKDGSKRWFILDPKKTIALKAKASEIDAYGVPFGISALANISFSSEYENSQYKLVQELASSIYYLILPESDKKGICSLNKEQQKNVIAAFENAIKINTSGNKGTKISTLTLAPGSQINRLSKDTSLLKDTLSSENLKKISTNLGFAISALNAESDSSNLGSLEINLNLISAQIFQYVKEIAKEQTRVINEHLGIKPANYIDIKYLPITWLNKKETYDKAKDLFMTAGGSRKYYIAAAGFDPDDYLNICDEEIEDGLDEKYPPHITSYTASDSGDKENPDGNLGGRPKKDDDELKESGKRTRNLKSNELKIKNKQ